MTIANKLTLLRVVMIPAFLIVLYVGFKYSVYVAAAIFVAASLTDFADGYVARLRGEVTNFGKFLDPLADKVLVFAAMMWFTERGVIPGWATLIVILREFAVTALRLVAADNKSRVIAASLSAKIKTAVTMTCLTVMFFNFGELINHVCVALIIVTTLWSGAEYFVKNRDSLKWDK